jgi:hypothetical protein
MPYLEHDLPHEERPKLAEASLKNIFLHMARASAVLLCILTEIQALFRFDGARINERLRDVWNATLPAPDVKELYESRYERLMKDKGILP